MKSLSLFVSTLLVGFSLQASLNNPLIRFCNLTNGLFHVVKMNGDQVGFCRYEKAMIDSLSVLDATTANYDSSATRAALNIGSSCSAAGGENLTGEDLEGFRFELCLFEDGSVIESATLLRGSADAENAGLVQALKMRF